MPGSDQYQKWLFELAEQRRQNGISDRMGTIHQVWTQNGEQKVRVNMGLRQDGTPWLSPWLHTEDHRGAHRHEEKYHKGMNVKLSAVGGDFRQATVSPHGENQAHQRPNHATDTEMAEQYDTLREGHGHDFHEHWLAPQSTEAAAQGQQAPTQMTEEKKDDVSKAIVLIRIGARPQNEQQQQGAWDGPPTTGGKPKSKLLVWVKGKGQKAPPDIADEIHIQFADKTHTVLTDGQIIHRVGTSTSITSILENQITHMVGKTSALSILPNNISAMVGGAGGDIAPEMIPGLLGPLQAIMTQLLGPLIGAGNSASAAAAMMSSVIGQVGAGTAISAPSDLAAQVNAALQTSPAAQLGPAALATLSASLQSDLTAAFAARTTLAVSDPTTIAAQLATTISSATAALSSDQVNTLAHTLAGSVLNDAVLAALPLDTGTSFDISSTGNQATMLNSITSAITSALGGQAAVQGMGVDSGMMQQVTSQLMQTMQGLSGGSVLSLLPKMVSKVAQQDINLKSKNSIVHTAMQAITQKAATMTHNASGLFKLLGLPVDINN